MNICCPKCKSNKVYSTDNQPLYHPHEYKEDAMNYENEVYVSFTCSECNNDFDEVFTMVPQVRVKPVEQRYAVDMTRTSVQSKVIYVYATSSEEAKKAALGIAGDYEYKEVDANYQVDDVKPEPLQK